MYKGFRIQLLAVLFFLPSLLFAQKGIVRGSVIDNASGEALFGVTVVVRETVNGAITDFDGKFQLNLEPGTYDLQASFVSYKAVTITGVNVVAGEVTLIDNIRLAEDVAELEEVVITAEAIRTTESALQTVKKKSANVIDGISAASFQKIGDSDAAGAVKRVTGVSVEGGKYVYVRGLGDRYTKTTLNNMDIPGLDPDRNSIQIDIFPTNLIDNMIVLKSSLAEMPADFTGGIVNIETKDFPDEKIFNVSVGMDFNPSMHFNSSYLDYEGSNTDWLGFDTDTRALPNGANAVASEIPSPINGSNDEEVSQFVNSFSPTLGPIQTTSFTDYSLGLSYGNQVALKNDNKLGYIFSATYRNSTRFYDNYIFGEYQLDTDPDSYELIRANTQNGVVGENNVLLGGLGGLAYKTQNSKYKLTAMHLQNGESRAANFFLDNSETAPGQSGYIGDSYNLEYNQRGLTNLLLSGNHFFDNGKWEIDWRLSPTLSTMEDPDIRKTAFTLSRTGGMPRFNAGAAGNPTRIWRSLEEINAVGRLDITREYQAFGEDAKLKFGTSYTYKQRDYEILMFTVQFFGAQPSWEGNPQEVLQSENLYPTGNAYIASSVEDPNPNQYNSNVNNFAFYISNEFQVSKDLKAILGLRAENFVQRHTGRDVEFASFGTGNNLDNEKVLDALDFFPSANLIYSLNDDQNLRGSYSRTIARPSFKELSFAQILDPVSNRIFNGGLYQYEDWDGGLSETRIDNLDLRWELFLPGAQIFSVSAFYKFFDDPIELVRIPLAPTTSEFQPRNVGDGQVYGLEFEFRKNLDFISLGLENFSLNGNVTLVHSIINMTNTEFESRSSFEKVGETIEDTRPMQGQAPYIINGGIGYENFEIGLDAGLFYNVQGETLTVVGGGLFPDVFSEPFHSLNFNLNKSFGLDQRTSVNLSVTNILNDVREEFYTGFGATDQYFTSFNPGTSIGLGLRHSF